MLTNEQLLQVAMEASKMAYAPYSNFHVGAALECSDGTVYTGCNIENASYGAANCAERTAIFKAVSEGHTDIMRMAIYSPDSEMFAMSCGICRQVMAEFNYDMEVIFAKANGEFKVMSLREVLPDAFTPESLK
jgi:cytidine deaminase